MRTNVPEIRASVTGFLTPTYVDHDAHGRMLNAFSDPDDIRRIQTGYACGNCCATFGAMQLKCPICHMDMDLTGHMSGAPSEWQEFYDHHNYGGEEHDSKHIRTPDEFIADVMKDTEIDQAPLSKLKRSKKPRLG